jgi:predicted nucleic acid-binding protein
MPISRPKRRLPTLPISASAPVFIDSGAWIALYVEDDAHHSEAKGTWQQLVKLSTRLCTSNYVLDETLTRLRMLGGHALAVRFGDIVFRSNSLERIYVDQEVEAAAWSWFVRYDDHELSFTDCVSFAVMQMRAIRVAFTFDTDFTTAGFERVPL